MSSLFTRTISTYPTFPRDTPWLLNFYSANFAWFSRLSLLPPAPHPVQCQSRPPPFLLFPVQFVQETSHLKSNSPEIKESQGAGNAGWMGEKNLFSEQRIGGSASACKDKLLVVSSWRWNKKNSWRARPEWVADFFAQARDLYEYRWDRDLDYSIEHCFGRCTRATGNFFDNT